MKDMIDTINKLEKYVASVKDNNDKFSIYVDVNKGLDASIQFSSDNVSIEFEKYRDINFVPIRIVKFIKDDNVLLELKEFKKLNLIRVEIANKGISMFIKGNYKLRFKVNE